MWRLPLSAIACALCIVGCDEQKTSEYVVQPAQQNAKPTELVTTPDFSGENAYVHCDALCAIGPRPSGSEAYLRQLEYLEKHLHAAGWQTFRDTFKPLPNGPTMINLRATRGDQQQQRPLLISCHIDTKINIAPDFVGADDGASAAAAMLELARVMPQAHAQQIELIFFDGEESFAPRMTPEDGLYGSRYDVKRRAGKLPTWQINLDMVGGRNKTIAIPSTETSNDMYAHYRATIRELNLNEERWTVWPGGFMDDHLPYFEAGVNSINLIAAFVGSDWWHTTRDNMSRICPKSLQESGRVTLHLIQRLLSPAENQN